MKQQKFLVKWMDKTCMPHSTEVKAVSAYEAAKAVAKKHSNVHAVQSAIAIN